MSGCTAHSDQITAPNPDEAAAALWQPLTITARKLRNRVVVAPMSRVSACGDGVPTAAMGDYYRAFARGGFALIITEGVFTASRASQSYANQPGLVTDEQVRGWRHVTAAVHEDGALAVAQLMHGGALSQLLAATLAPSAVQPRGEKMPEYGGTGAYPLPSAMTEDDIAEAVTGFATSARLAADAGFDGVEVHAANGYLLDQFITSYTNLRDDRYGGPPGARTGVVAEVVAAIRAATGTDFLIGVRLSQTKVNDSRHRWRDRTEAQAILQTVAHAHPDYVHLASEGRPWTDIGVLPDHTLLGPLARELTGLPVMVNGGLDDPALAAQMLDTGQADLVSLARGALANPDWPQRVKAGDWPFTSGMINPRRTEPPRGDCQIDGLGCRRPRATKTEHRFAPDVEMPNGRGDDPAAALNTLTALPRPYPGPDTPGRPGAVPPAGGTR